MISYQPYGTPFWESLSQKSEAHPALRDVLETFDTPEEGDEIAAADAHGCLLLRVLTSGRYCFCYPIPYAPGASVEDALTAIEEYAVAQEVPLFYINVASEDLPTLLPRYRHIRADVQDEGVYTVRVVTEGERREQIPTLRGERVSLSALSRRDIGRYAELCRDEETLRYFGYDYRADCPRARAVDFYRAAVREFSRGVAIPFAIRRGSRLVGEITLYAFDGRGRAEFSVRILPAYRRLGYAREAISLVTRFSFSDLGLVSLTARCRRENLPSATLLSSLAPLVLQDEDVLIFRFTPGD